MGKNVEFHDYLRELRIKASLPQDVVAKALGYRSSQFISNWERGSSHPPLKAIRKLAKMYNVAPDEMYLRVENAILKDMRSSLRRRFEKTKE